ncbi:methylmalonyl-CoA epimerase [Melghirimyces profundicolus]|uniref:Methylmalonyl-CoA epimerase n=1 Tax=Melghirimyces profundicolus TaxID=1242148 RepID=A0A2T6B802_9BACL|nr:methylmalonyl-CoA epimerase [Melghirimyces profundicolus]PTX52211.1 methylmalonyl-CoA epimerase [Melghirimyces profundicolus]
MTNRSVSPERIDHVGIAVRSLDEAVPLYRDILGLKYLGEESVESEQVRIAFFRLGETRIELLEPLSADSPIAGFLEKRGEGIHHIALKVDGIEEKLEGLTETGIRLIHERPKRGAEGSRVAFIHPKSTRGVLYELCEPQLKGEPGL